MAETFISPQQASPAPGEVKLYTCPASTSFVGSTLIVCNTAGTPTTLRTRIAVNDASVVTKQYIYYDAPIAANTTVTLTVGITLSAGDVIYVDAGASGVAFNLVGVEVT